MKHVLGFLLAILCGIAIPSLRGQTRLVVFPTQPDPGTDTTTMWAISAMDHSVRMLLGGISPKTLLTTDAPPRDLNAWSETAKHLGADVAVHLTMKVSSGKATVRLETAEPARGTTPRRKAEFSHEFPAGWYRTVEEVLSEILKISVPKYKPDWKRIRTSSGLDGTWAAYETVMRSRRLLAHHPEFQDSAGAMLGRLAGQEPGYFAVHAALGDCRRKVRQVDLAMESYRRALAIDSLQPGLFQAIGDLYFYHKDDLRLARDAYRRELAISPDAVHTMIQIGHTYYIQKEYGQAQSYAKQALGIRPGASPAFNLLGLCAMATKDSSQAFELFAKAAGADPMEIPARKNLARLHEQRGEFDEAMRLYREVLQTDPRDAGALMALATLEYHTGRAHPAVMHYLEAVLYDPDLESARANPNQILQVFTHNRRDLAGVNSMIDSLEDAAIDVDDEREMFRIRTALGYLKLYYADRAADAINDLDVAYKLGPHEKRVAFYLGEAYFKVGKYARSFEYFHSYVPYASSAFNYAKCLQMIGKILIRQNRFEEAQLEILKSLRMYPNAESYYYYGLALRGSQQAEAAVAALERAVKLYPQYTEAYLELGNTYFALKRYDEALVHLHKAATLDSLRASLHQSLALIHLVKNDLATAEQEIRTALTMAPRTGEPVSGFHGSYGDILLQQQRWAEARGQYELQLAADTSAVIAWYRIAATYAAGRDAKRAMASLETAFQKGFTNFGMFDEDKSFDALRDNRTFNALVGQYREEYNKALMKKLKVKE